MTTLTPREVDSLHFAVRADRQALSNTRIVSAVEEIVAARLARIEAQIAHLELLTTQLRAQGDVRQVMLGDDGVDEAPSLADELWLIAYNLRAALGGAS